MKYILLMILVFIFAMILVPVLGKDKSKADMFVDALILRIENKNSKVTKEEKDALRKLHTLLLKIADNKSIRKNFWFIVRQSNYKQKSIDWKVAKKLVMDGKVIHAIQGHDLTVMLWTKNKKYITKEPKIDDILNVILKVDPKLVFIKYGTE